ncbi:MAG: S8 family serine peptidase [Hyphomicrobiaceae bacterium]
MAWLWYGALAAFLMAAMMLLTTHASAIGPQGAPGAPSAALPAASNSSSSIWKKLQKSGRATTTCTGAMRRAGLCGGGYRPKPKPVPCPAGKRRVGTLCLDFPKPGRGSKPGGQPYPNPGSKPVVCPAGKRRIGKLCLTIPTPGGPNQPGGRPYPNPGGGPVVCPSGKRRLGKLCIPVPQPGGNAQQGGSSTGPGSVAYGCEGGTAKGRSCVCPAGKRAVPAGPYRMRCVGVPCPPGKYRVGDICVGRQPPPDPPPVVCSGGTSAKGGSCRCPAGTYPVRSDRYRITCVPSPCPRGQVRVGRACIGIGTPPPPQLCPDGRKRVAGRCYDRECPDGWRRIGRSCHRIAVPTCPDGMLLRAGRCYGVVAEPPRATPPPPRPPRIATPPRPLPPPTLPTPAAQTQDVYVDDEVLVEIAAASPQPIVNRLVATFGLQTLSSRRLGTLGVGLYRFRIPRGRSAPDVVASLTAEPGVSAAQLNYIYRLNAGRNAPPGDAASAKLPQYAVDLMKVREAHEVTRGASVLVAVIDTGVDETHPEFDTAVAARFNAMPEVTFNPDPHGTAIAGIIAARRQLEGVAPDSRILAVQAFDARGGTGTTERIAAGLDWAMLKGAKVVNMSFEGAEDSLVTRLIERGDSAGVVFVAAAGNGGPSAEPAFPASLPSVIAVTAIDDHRAVYAHANAGAYIDVAAPGVDVLAPVPGGGYDMMSGTSFAAAHVSGIAALILASSPRIGREHLLRQLKATSDDLGEPGPDSIFGAGSVDALRAVIDRRADAGR